VAHIKIITLIVVVGAVLGGCGPEKPPVEKPPVVVAAGDIATCSGTGDEATARLIGGIDGTVLALGDNAYPDGSAEDFDECYDPTWGRFKDRTKPAPGNHEYHTPGGSRVLRLFREGPGHSLRSRLEEDAFRQVGSDPAKMYPGNSIHRSRP
jgi:hypothetical protein